MEKKTKYILAAAAMLVFCINSTFVCRAKENLSLAENEEESVFTRTDFAMDTPIAETLYTTGEDITEEITQVINDADAKWISWSEKSSELYQINESSGGEFLLSEEMAGYLKKVMQLWEDSDGALDPTLGKLTQLWNLGGENPKVPEEEEIQDALANAGLESVELDGSSLTMEQGCTLDLGAVGKGIVCDEIISYLEQQPEVTAAIVNLGGSSVTAYGQKPDGSQWRVAVTDPRDTQGDYLGSVVIYGGEFLSTSGDYQRYIIQDGIRYHHILDPQTGYPSRSGVTGVTVVCSNGLIADGLSTACFVLGWEKAEPLLEKYEADALFVDEEQHVYLTEGMKERFQLLKDNYSLQQIHNP